jgi:hypothetical protein
MRLAAPLNGAAPAYRSRMVRGALAGVLAAGAWAAAEPLARRMLRTSYSDVRLLGGLIAPSRWRQVGLLAHLINGAAFGVAFVRLGGHGPMRGVLAAEAENLLLWPSMAVFERIHPDRRTRDWGRLFGSRTIFTYEALMHALFGVVLGVLTAPRARGAGRANATRLRG